MKKLISLALILIFLFSCGGRQNDDKLNVAGTHDTSEVTTADDYNDDLGIFDFDGYEFKMYTRDNPLYHSPINIAEEVGEILNDAMYRRNRTLEERFNFTFVESMGSGDGNAVTNRARNSIMAGDNEFDIITLHIKVNITFAQEGLIYPISALPHLNPDKPYWNQKLRSDLTVINKQYFTVGAYDLSGHDFIAVLLFNKQMIKDYSLENLYDLAKSSRWTFDKFGEMAKITTVDLNGDGKFDKDDQYGFLAMHKQVLPSFWIAAGVKTVEKDKDDIPYSAMGSEKFIQVFDKIFAITQDEGTWYGKDQSQVNLDTMFKNSQGLFMDTTFYFVNTLRDMETDFGIIPFPKYTENQDSYYSRIEGLATAIVPISANEESLERTSVILEALACESHKTVIPAYYDVSLKVRNTRDVESEEMLDIIFNNSVFDFGDALWDPQIRDGIFAPMFRDNNRNLVSKLASMEEIIKGLSDVAVEAFEKLN